MGLLNRLVGFVQDLFSGRGVVQAVRQFQEEEPTPEAQFFERVEREKIEEIEEEREDFIRKIVKTGGSRGSKSSSLRDTKVDLFALTFENNLIDRGQWLYGKIEEYAEDENIFLTSSWGYEDSEEVEDPPFEYPEFEVGEE